MLDAKKCPALCLLAVWLGAVSASSARAQDQDQGQNSKSEESNKAVLSVCDLRAPGAFPEYQGSIVTVAGQLDANDEVTLLSSDECAGAVYLIDDQSLKEADPSIALAYRAGVDAKRSCRDERPFRVVLRGRLDLGSYEFGLLYGFKVADVLESDFSAGVSRACAYKTAPARGPARTFFPERLEIEGHVAAFHWPGRVFPGFEGIHIEHLVVLVDKVLKGEAAPRFIRADFWAFHDNEDYTLPDAVFEAGHLFHFNVTSPSAASAEHESCQADVQQVVKFTDEEQHTSVGIMPAFTLLDSSQALPTFRSLPCYELTKKQNLSLIE
jgi:hypothetical protein